MQIAVGRALLLRVAGAILGQMLPRPRESLEIARRDGKIRLCQEAQPLEFPMTRHKHDKEQQKEGAQHELCGRRDIIAVDECSEHCRKDKCAREDVARPLPIL